MWIPITISVLLVVFIVYRSIVNDKEKLALKEKIWASNEGLEKEKQNVASLNSLIEKYEKFFELIEVYDESSHDDSPPSKEFIKSIERVLNSKDYERTKEFILLKNRIAFLESTQSNLTAIPYMAQIMADYKTYGIEMQAKELDWGYNQKRIEKVENIRTIRKKAKEEIEISYNDRYQLAYLLELYPALKDIIDTEFNSLPALEFSDLSDYDRARDYLSKEEYDSLSCIERNQLALDRYFASHKKSKWQVGRDYELYIGYRFEKQGFSVDYFGSYMGLEDLGRDLIVTANDFTHIVQCKYWSKIKQIHEKHILQLYGTVVSYCFEKQLPRKKVDGILITNIYLSDTAKKMAKYLGIKYEENIAIDRYPSIKCNLGKDKYGWTTKIYHLPFDQQYDNTKVNKKGEFMATTVREAEEAGFRRAFKWYGNS